MSTNVYLNQIIGAVASFVEEEVNMTRVKVSLSDKSEYTELLRLLVSLKFETDFRLVKGYKDLQEIYDSIRIVEAGETNVKIRFLMDVADFVFHYTDVDIPTDSTTREFVIDELSRMLVIHSDVDLNKTTYDNFITDNINEVEEWIIALENNAWLVSAILINKIPSRVFMNLLLELENTNKDSEV